MAEPLNAKQLAAVATGGSIDDDATRPLLNWADPQWWLDDWKEVIERLLATVAARDAEIDHLKKQLLTSGQG